MYIFLWETLSGEFWYFPLSSQANSSIVCWLAMFICILSGVPKQGLILFIFLFSIFLSI